MRSLSVPAALPCACLFVCLCAGSVRGEWVDQRTVDIFHIRSEFDLSDAEGQALLAEMTNLREEIQRLLRIEAASDPIEVNLFASRRSFRKFLAIRVPEGVDRAALYVKGADMGRVYVHQHRNFATDLRHECTHAILHNALPYVPLWLDEGLAEYFEVAAPLRGRANPHLKNVRWSTRLGREPSLSSLEEKRQLASMSADDYRDAWAWIHFLLHGPEEARQVLSNYLYDIRVGNPAGQLSERLAGDVPGVTTLLVDHFRTWK